MVTSLLLLSCVLAPAQPADQTEWQLTPRLGRAQELVYRGSFTEEALANAVQCNRQYRLESRVFVLDTPTRGMDVAFLTTLKPRNAAPAGAGGASVKEEPSVSSVRLELAQVDGQGRVTADPGVVLTVPLEGPPTFELGAFVEVPRNRVTRGQSWETGEEGRPVRSWQVAGTEMINSTSCLKLVGVQESDDWERPRGDRMAWRRQDTVWLSPRLGIAYRVERVIEKREPARKEPTQRSVLRYELETNLQYPGQLFEDRRREILQARSFAESAAPLLSNPTRYASQLEALQGKIASHLDRHPPTPYRDAVLQVKRRVDAGRRGETPPPALPEENTPNAPTAALHRRAPDFVAPDFTNQESARLRRWLGKPVVMVFYSPTSMTADELLRFAQKVNDRYPQEVTVLGLAMTEDAERVRKQRGELRLTFPLLNGTGLKQSYDVEATPKVVVLDADGVVRGSYVGWGRETSLEIVEELKRWLPRKK